MRIGYVLLVSCLTVVLSGCQVFDGMGCGRRCHPDAHASSSLVDFLYPSGAVPPAENSIPQLNLPVRVGLAFLPSHNGTSPVGLEASRRDELLERIRQHFASRKFVAQIVVIPDYYLSGRAGFQGLAGVQRLYGIDVMALVSYDQVTYRDANTWSLGYLTIVGSYFIKGTRHEVTTLLDMAVVDPASRSILLRAGGTDERHGTTTLVSEERETRQSDTESFSYATDNLVENFDAALSKFESDVREGKAQVRVAKRSGGAGALDLMWIVALAGVGAMRIGWARGRAGTVSSVSPWRGIPKYRRPIHPGSSLRLP